MTVPSLPAQPDRALSAPHVPTRTCVGCREAGPATNLVRLVLREGSLVVCGATGRVSARPAGRGAWIHPNDSCVAAAFKTRSWNRAFRANVNVGPGDSMRALTAAISVAAGRSVH